MPTASLAYSDLTLPPQFGAFLTVIKNRNVSTNPATAIGQTNQTAFGSYWESWQQGSGGDLSAGLAKVDKTINQAIQLNAAP